MGALRLLDRLVDAAVRGAAFLVLPVSLLLFLQWPLRDLVHLYSREANDLAQVLFALYVSVAITQATRRGAHLAADTIAQRYSPAWRERLNRGAALVVLIPWSLFLLFAGSGTTWFSVMQLERFQDTLNPGYFLVRLAAMLLAALVLAQAVIDLFAPRQTQSR